MESEHIYDIGYKRNMTRKIQQKRDSLGRMMVYVLGRRPDEFGLVPDKEGFVSFKHLLMAFHEEPEWRYVRQTHFREVLMGKDQSHFEWDDKRIRVPDRQWPLHYDADSKPLPKILFLAIRRKAHGHALEKGLRSAPGRYLVLAGDTKMALKMGYRQDRSPVLLEVQVAAAQKEGVMFRHFGLLFLAEELPPTCLSGPPLPKEKEIKPGGGKKKKEQDVPLPLEPGTFFLDADRDPALHRRGKGRKGKGWKEEARRMRRKKRS
jgi:putative RNA 2'-phosphotransferase